MKRVDDSSAAHGIGPFVTWIATETEHGHRLQTSRRQRKQLSPIRIPTGTHSPLSAFGRISHDWFRIWIPAALGWWIAVLFMIGSALFGIGGFRAAWPGMSALDWIASSAVNPIFFIGSLFFTAAAYLQFYEALNGDLTVSGAPRRFLGWRPRNLGYLAALIQLVGTFLFNRDTGDALITGLGWWEEDLLVWKPAVIGCVCFLVSSQLAIMEYAHGWFAFRPAQLSWWIVASNMLGSILFMVSGIAGFVKPDDALISPFLSNAGTFGGAVCFFLGSYLLIPELSETET